MIFALWKRVYVYINITLYLYKIHHHDTLQTSFTIIHPPKNIHSALLFPLQDFGTHSVNWSVLSNWKTLSCPQLSNQPLLIHQVDALMSNSGGLLTAKKYGEKTAPNRFLGRCFPQPSGKANYAITGGWTRPVWTVRSRSPWGGKNMQTTWNSPGQHLAWNFQTSCFFTSKN